MRTSTTVLLSLLCALMMLAIPLLIPSGAMLLDAKEAMQEEFAPDDGENWDNWFSRLLFASANAEEIEITPLPIDLTVGGYEPNPKGFAADSYEDASIKVRMESRYENGVSWRIAFVEIADASQLRTTTANPKKVSSTATATATTMAKRVNAIVAINGDYYQNQTDSKTFEYRMGTKIRNKSNKKRDILFIDENGDFHIFQCQNNQTEKMKQFSTDGHQIINAFTFGPALVVDGEIAFNPVDNRYDVNQKNPRAAIGQIGPLNYVLVLAEGRDANNSSGATGKELAEFMFKLGCQQAYNLDGGNSAELIFNNKMYQDSSHSERDVNDIIYFASAVDPQEWK